VSIFLLDVNVLVAMIWPEHIHHEAVRRWLGRHRADEWASCPVTQAGFVRVSAQPVFGGVAHGVQYGLHALERNCGEPRHVFWAQDSAVVEMLAEIRERLAGHQQLTDAVLLDLAIRKGGQLATLDRRVATLLPPDSPHRSAIEVIPV
jgi:toxin-antitoxin system PIN domain toxin